MKKILVLLFSLLLLTGCNKNPGNVINENDARLSTSMKNFYSEECVEYGKGENFQVKVCSLVKVENELQNVYRYQILVAPLTDGKKAINGIQIEPEHPEVFTATSSKITYCGIGQGYMWLALPMWEKLESFEAYRFDFCFDNVSNEYEEQIRKLNGFDMDEMMQNLTVTIGYNLTDKEVIKVNIGKMQTVSSIDDELMERDDIRKIYNHQTSAIEMIRHPFEGEYSYPISAVTDYEETPVETFAKEQIRELGLYDENSVFEIMEHVAGLDNDALYCRIAKDELPEKASESMFKDVWYYYPVYKDGEMIFAIKEHNSDFSVVSDEQILNGLQKVLSEHGSVAIVELDGNTYVFNKPIFNGREFRNDYFMLSGDADEKAINNNMEVLRKIASWSEFQNIDLTRRTRLY
ncbi:MAG: lipoprotein [Erysipelotrichaceae bacterium]|nr:lipoprotein [Erysipelotrichaceae bacterium]